MNKSDKIVCTLFIVGISLIWTGMLPLVIRPATHSTMPNPGPPSNALTLTLFELSIGVIFIFAGLVMARPIKPASPLPCE
jgi:hypothetical protein